MSIKEIVNQYKKLITDNAVNEQEEEKMLEELDKIEDKLLGLERMIEDNIEHLEEYDNTMEDAESEFLYANALQPWEF